MIIDWTSHARRARSVDVQPRCGNKNAGIASAGLENQVPEDIMVSDFSVEEII
jgi:hypothetical protein